VVLGGFTFWGAGKVPRDDSIPFTIARGVVWSIPLGCAAGVVWFGYKWVQNAADNARITDEGIEVKQDLYPWEQVAAVYGTRMAGGIMIQFDPRSVPSKTIGGLGMVMPRSLMTTPFLKAPEFESLMDALETQIVPLYPHVNLDRVVRTSSN
jgi:hypothetical protein